LVIETFNQPDDIYTSVFGQQPSFLPVTPVTFCATTDKHTYINNINQLRTHIRNGDCYEINYCNHHFASDVDIDPVSVFKTLNTFSPAPFAAYYRLNDTYVMCASPERYLKKTGARIVSQPIKGTARRGDTTVADEFIKTELRNDAKEQAENVMIVDLVRNDLAITCIPGTIEVEELFGIYSFPHVHQMISTVAGELLPDSAFTDPIGHSFPMGSMTGAPKYKVMQLIDQYESVRRELFSGSVGYITPHGDFDLNVVIRSLFYNATSRYLSYNTGGAITYDSIPENEWDEMQLKGWALEKIFRS
jgi:para-aminobenzoate synthetase component 1